MTDGFSDVFQLAASVCADMRRQCENLFIWFVWRTRCAVSAWEKSRNSACSLLKQIDQLNSIGSIERSVCVCVKRNLELIGKLVVYLYWTMRWSPSLCLFGLRIDGVPTHGLHHKIDTQSFDALKQRTLLIMINDYRLSFGCAHTCRVGLVAESRKWWRVCVCEMGEMEWMQMEIKFVN